MKFVIIIPLGQKHSGVKNTYINIELLVSGFLQNPFFFCKASQSAASSKQQAAICSRAASRELAAQWRMMMMIIPLLSLIIIQQPISRGTTYPYGIWYTAL